MVNIDIWGLVISYISIAMILLELIIISLIFRFTLFENDNVKKFLNIAGKYDDGLFEDLSTVPKLDLQAIKKYEGTCIPENEPCYHDKFEDKCCEGTSCLMFHSEFKQNSKHFVGKCMKPRVQQPKINVVYDNNTRYNKGNYVKNMPKKEPFKYETTCTKVIPIGGMCDQEEITKINKRMNKAKFQRRKINDLCEDAVCVEGSTCKASHTHGRNPSGYKCVIEHSDT